MQKCPVCNASFPATQFVCSYCGHVETERIKKIDEDTVKKMSFADSMTLIKENLNALQETQRPKAGGNLLAILRILVAIQTFGIVLFFWKKPKNRFRPKEFKKLKAIVGRNIELLKLSAKGSDQLQDRISVTETELKTIDQEIKKSLLIRRIVTIVVIAVYISIIFMNKGGKHGKLDIIPASTVIEGDLSKNIELLIEQYPVRYSLDKNKMIKKARATIKIKIVKVYQFADNETPHFRMTLKNNQGMKLLSINESDLNEWDTKRLKKAIEKSVGRTVSATFYFIPNYEIETLPSVLKKFTVSATIDTVRAGS